jgi:NlpC/P60 family putative phage cell wall peptidase
MASRPEIVAEARRWLGTPYRHQGRRLGESVDCIGLVVGVARALDLGDWAGVYGRQPDPAWMGRELGAHLDPIEAASVLPGDVLWLRFARSPTHLAIVTDVGMIHAYSPRKRVVEHSIDMRWRRRVHAAYAFRGVG